MNIICKIPAELEKYKEAIGIGIFYLALGKRSKKKIGTTGGEKKSVRIKLSAEAERYFKMALEAADLGGVKSAVITAALAYIAENPRLRNIKI